MKKITVYSGPLCAFCDAAKRLLGRNNLTYKEIDISFGTSKAVQATEIGETNLCNFEPMEPVVTISIN